ncbi:MAG: YfiR family protein [Bacteroidales bacterium]
MKKSLLIVLILLNISKFGFAQKEKVEAMYIYQFTKLVDWCPAYKTGDFVIGVVGTTPVYNELQALAGKPVANQKIVIKKYETIAEMDRCNILFIPADKSKVLTEANRKIKKNCTLVVTEKNGLILNGAAVNFIETSGKVVFEMNKTILEEHSLKVNNKLYAMAKTVYQSED